MTKFKMKQDQPIAPDPIPRYEQAYRLSRGKIMLNNFLGGIAWALGSVIGLAILFTILGLIVHYVNLIPYIGNFIAEIIKYLQINKGIR